MSWETRGSNRYYYRRRKVNGRIIAEYMGAGYLAEVAAELDEIERLRRELAAAEWRAVVEAEREQSAALARVEEIVKSAVAAVLIANGYHTHKRQWRRMR